MNAFLARRFLYYQEPSHSLRMGIWTVKDALEQELPTQDMKIPGCPTAFEVYNTHYPNMLPSTLPHAAREIIHECNNATDCAS